MTTINIDEISLTKTLYKNDPDMVTYEIDHEMKRCKYILRNGYATRVGCQFMIYPYNDEFPEYICQIDDDHNCVVINDNVYTRTFSYDTYIVGAYYEDFDPAVLQTIYASSHEDEVHITANPYDIIMYNEITKIEGAPGAYLYNYMPNLKYLRLYEWSAFVRPKMITRFAPNLQQIYIDLL